MGSELWRTNQKRNLGVVVDRSMKTFTQCKPIIKPNSILRVIRKRFEKKNANRRLHLHIYGVATYRILDVVLSVTPLEEYCRAKKV